jgi:hypothetical protein
VLSHGYWKTAPHRAHTSSLLPITLGGYSVTSYDSATAVFDQTNCGNSKDQNAIGCLAGQLLAAKLNVANGADTCINPAIARADSFLSGGTVDGVSGVSYTGPTGTFSLTSAQRAKALDLHGVLATYNGGGGCV